MATNDQQNKEVLDLSEKDLTDLVTALNFDDSLDMIRWYVDTEEEKMVMYRNAEEVSEENDRLGEQINQNPDRFLRIHPTNSDQEWNVMAAFIEDEVEDPVVRNRLREAIDGSGAFRRFRKVVAQEGLKDHWHAYQNREDRKHAIEWLESRSLITDEKAEEFRANLVDDLDSSKDEDELSGPEQMTEGGIVICRREGGHKGLSEGTEYEIVDERPADNLIQVQDDRNNRKWYQKQQFDVVEPGRERDLDDLLMNIEVERKGDHFAHARVLFDRGGSWTVRVATPEWVEKHFDPEPKGAFLGLRKIVIVPSLKEKEVNRSLTALNQDEALAAYALKKE